MLQHLVTDKNFSICMHFVVKCCVVVSVDYFSNFILFVVFQCRGVVAPTFSPVVYGSSIAAGLRVGIHLALQPLATPIQLPFRYLRRLPQFQLVQTSASVRFMSLHHSCVEHGQLIMEEVLPGLTQEVAYQEAVAIEQTDEIENPDDSDDGLESCTASEAEESEGITPIPKSSLDEGAVNKADAKIQHAIRLRNNLVDVVFYQNEERYRPMLRQLQALNPTKKMLKVSGLGIVLNHMRMWPEPLRTDVLALAEKWNKLGPHNRDIDGCWLDVRMNPDHQMIWGGRKRQSFMQTADTFATWFIHNDPEVSSDVVQKKAAFLLTLRGFTNPKALADVDIEEVAHMTTDPVVKSTVRRAIEVETSRACALRHKRKLDLIELARKKHIGDVLYVDGNAIAHEMFAAAAPDALDKADHKLKLQGVSSTTDRPKPQQLMKQFQKASQQGNKENLVANMEEKMSAVQAHCWAGSNGSVRSGLKSFCTFALNFLGYNPGETLPPRSARDVCLWLCCCFTCSGTAANYVSYLRSGCTKGGFGKMEWDDHSVKMSLKGLTKMNIKLWQGPKRIAFLLRYFMVQALATYNQYRNLMAMALFIVFNYEFCLRSKSEGLLVYVGRESDTPELLRSGLRPNGVHIKEENGEKMLVYVMGKRKNRPQGSFLVRRCHCCRPGNRVCVVCEAAKALVGRHVAEICW